ncbi:amino acid permease [Raineyella sp. W15-4]|uniref:amino acid permease n=1 Tax=Raineyella sp. W15-4 TaxID=3081651 RepID=UPI0029557EC9|nr:amino acid permease [Raineyella sp. W15-4]WOQ17664.1 amino acid permease [Raineyella sp. W15-4]
MSLFVKKTIGEVQQDLADPERSLRRDLSAWDIAVMGVAVAVGAGIFSVGAQAAANYAGPAVIISFIIAALVCGLAVMNYAEFASTIPVSGSAYTFSYVSLGELIAWIIGWDLILEMLMAASVISKYWGIYVRNVFEFLHVDLPTEFPLGALSVSWPPVLIVALFTVLLVLGTKLTSRVNGVLTVIKIGITLFIIVAGAFYVKAANFSPFLPPAEPTAGSQASGVMTQSLFAFLSGAAPTRYGVYGLLAAAALVFFAFIGFDIVATTAEEAKDPQRTLPRGIFGGLALVSVLYVAVTIVVTGMVSYQAMAKEKEPSLATAFRLVGANWVGTIITIGILIGLTTVIMVLLLGLARVVFAMSRDGLLPRGLSHTSSRGTPARLQILSGVVVAAIAALADVNQLSEMINIGTLSAFVLVSFSVPVLRRRYPDLKRGFTVPWSPTLPIISGVLCLWLMANLAVETWLRFVVWLLVGLTLYFGYSYRHSRARLEQDAELPTASGARPGTGSWTVAAGVLVGLSLVAAIGAIIVLLVGPGGAATLSGGVVWALILGPAPGIVAGHLALSGTGSDSVRSRAVQTILATGYGTAAVAVVVGIVHALAVL